MSQEPSKESMLIQSILLLIENGDDEGFKILIGQVPISRMEPQDKYHLLRSFLTPCFNYGRHRMTRDLIYTFDDADHLTDDSILYQLFGLVTFEEELVAFVIESFNQMKETQDNVTAGDVFDVMIEMDDGPNRYYACGRAESIMMELDYDSAKYFGDMAEQNEKYEVASYMREAQRRTAPFSKVPEYVKDHYHLKTQTEIWEILPDPVELSAESYVDNEDEAVKLLMSGVDDSGIYQGDRDELEKTTREIWGKMSNIQRRVQLAIIIDQLNRAYNSDNVTNAKVFRLLGPANSLVNSNNDTYHDICRRYGCRMLHCDCIEHVDPEERTLYDESDYDWFIQPHEDFASCYECQSRIPNRAAALRIPEIHGGWTGRFCSRECALSYQRVEPEQRQLLDVYLSELETIGLQSRE